MSNFDRDKTFTIERAGKSYYVWYSGRAITGHRSASFPSFADALSACVNYVLGVEEVARAVSERRILREVEKYTSPPGPDEKVRISAETIILAVKGIVDQEFERLLRVYRRSR